jgi:hypothetical protein
VPRLSGSRRSTRRLRGVSRGRRHRRTSSEAHRAGLERIAQAGAQPIGWVSLACELQRDWARPDTVAEVVDIVLTSRLLKGI